MRCITLLTCLLGLAAFGTSLPTVAQECPAAGEDVKERAADFFTTDDWRSERAKKNVADVRPSDLTPVTDPKTCAFIAENTSPVPKDFYAKAFFRLPDGRFVVYTYIKGENFKKIDENTYRIRTGFSGISVYSPEMKKLAGALL